ncbi:hypothetical protein ACI2KR_27195 [Pseudomonas luteola]
MSEVLYGKMIVNSRNPLADLKAENERLKIKLAACEEIAQHNAKCFGEASKALADMTDLYNKAQDNADALKTDAERWRALIACARIKFFGWSGYEKKDPYGNSPGNYRHFGAEFWTIHSHEMTESERGKAAEKLIGFADAARAAKLEGK